MIHGLRYLWVVLFFVAFNSAAKDDYGPLQVYSQSPFQTNSLTPQLRSGFSNDPDTQEFYLSGTAASIWANAGNYELDYYQNQISTGWKWQFEQDWQLALSYRWNYAGNNHLDGPTRWFHDLIGIDQNGREEVDDHRFIISIPDYDVNLEDFRGRTLSNAYTAYLQYQLYSSEHHAWSVGGSLYYNDINKGIFASSRFEQALQVNYGYQRGKHQADISAGYTSRRNQEAYQNFPLKKSVLSVSAGYRYKIAEQHTLIGEMSVYEGVSEGKDEFSKVSTEFTAGYRYTMESSALEISATENLFNADNSTDIAFTLGYRYRF